MRAPRPIHFLTGSVLVASALVIVLARRLIDLNRAYAELRERASLPYRGYAMPTFRATTLRGDSVTIAELSDPTARQLVFVFTTTCPFCKATLPVWAALADSARRLRRPINMVSLSLDSPEKTGRYAAEHHLTYPVATFPDWKTAQLFRARAVPQTLVLDHFGQVVFAHTGRLEAGPALDSVYAALRGEFGAFESRRAAPPAPGVGTGSTPTAVQR